jgi:lambda repressor-like predicted transcriptional regulator
MGIVMNEKKDYEKDVERNQIKNALINCAKTQGISLSELASEAGVSPSTVTGFVNDISTRAEHILSMRTISKLTKAFPDLATHLQLAESTPDVKEIRFLGLVNLQKKQMIVPLDPGSPGSTMIKNYHDDYVAYGIKSKYTLFKSRVYFCKPETISDPKNFNDFLNSLVIVDSAEGKHLGYLLSDATGQYYTAQMPNVHEQPIKLVDLTNINWIMPVDWIRP